jgi:Raf kinase inhibitor-like YbhB/YbcL family protein
MRFFLTAALVLMATPGFAMDLKSTDVADGAPIAKQFVCPAQGGKSISPELSWSGAPAEAKSFAVTIFDPDAPNGGHWHWQAIDIPAGTSELKQGAGAPKAMPTGTMQLLNGSGHTNYDGPCPPVGPAHHYHIVVYAMPTPTVAIPPDTGPSGVGALLKRQALATAEMVPVFGQ